MSSGARSTVSLRIVVAMLVTPVALLLTCFGAQAGAASARGHHAVVLKHGRYDVVKWTVGLGRSAGKGGSAQPCLSADFLNYKPEWTPGGEVAETSNGICSPIPRRGSPLILTSEAGNQGRRLTVFGMVFDPTVTYVNLEFNTGDSRSFQPILLRKRQALIGGVRPVRYAVLARAGEVCIRRIDVRGRGGSKLFHEVTPAGECS